MSYSMDVSVPSAAGGTAVGVGGFLFFKNK